MKEIQNWVRFRPQVMGQAQVTVNNKQVIAIFVLGIALLLAAFWGGLNVVKQELTPPPAQGENGTMRGGSRDQHQVPTSESKAPRVENEQPYIVRVGSFGTSDKANQLTADLRRRYQSAHIQSPDAESPLYRVNIGPYATRQEAMVIADELTNQGLKGVMILPWKE